MPIAALEADHCRIPLPVPAAVAEVHGVELDRAALEPPRTRD